MNKNWFNKNKQKPSKILSSFLRLSRPTHAKSKIRTYPHKFNCPMILGRQMTEESRNVQLFITMLLARIQLLEQTRDHTLICSFEDQEYPHSDCAFVFKTVPIYWRIKTF